MDFTLTEEQIMLQRMVREFAQKEIKPLAKELSAKPDPKDCMPWQLYKRADELGLRTMGIPEELGGSGEVDWLSRLIVTEELAAGDYDCTHLAGGGRRLMRLSKEQRDEFLPQFLKDYTFVMATTRTEPNHGSDQFIPYDKITGPLESTIQTFAEKKGDEYIINGTKHFASNSGIAKLYIVACRIDRKAPITECETNFLVPRDTPGVTVGKWMDKLGRRLLSNAEVTFEDVHVPARYLIGREGGVWEEDFEMLPVTMVSTQAGVLGLLRTCYEETLEYARNRVQGGMPILEQPTVALKLSKMRLQIEAARSLIWRCAWNFHAKQPDYDINLGWAVKGWVNEIAVDIVSKAVEIHGGLGIDKSMPIEKYLRDVYSLLHGFGTVDLAYIRGAPK